MVGLPRSIIKKYGVSKKAWAVFRGEKSSSRKRGARMARRGKGRRRGGSGGGIMGLLKPFIAGAVASIVAPSIPVVNGLPPLAQGAIGGYVVKRSVMGAAAGAAGAQFGAPLIGQVIGGSGVKSAQGTW